MVIRQGKKGFRTLNKVAKVSYKSIKMEPDVLPEIIKSKKYLRVNFVGSDAKYQWTNLGEILTSNGKLRSGVKFFSHGKEEIVFEDWRDVSKFREGKFIGGFEVKEIFFNNDFKTYFISPKESFRHIETLINYFSTKNRIPQLYKPTNPSYLNIGWIGKKSIVKMFENRQMLAVDSNGNSRGKAFLSGKISIFDDRCFYVLDNLIDINGKARYYGQFIDINFPIRNFEYVIPNVINRLKIIDKNYF